MDSDRVLWIVYTVQGVVDSVQGVVDRVQKVRFTVWYSVQFVIHIFYVRCTECPVEKKNNSCYCGLRIGRSPQKARRGLKESRGIRVNYILGYKVYLTRLSQYRY